MESPLQHSHGTARILFLCAILTLFQGGAPASPWDSDLFIRAQSISGYQPGRGEGVASHDVPLLNPGPAHFSSKARQASVVTDHFWSRPMSGWGWLFLGTLLPLLAPRSLGFFRRPSRKAALLLKEVLEIHEEPYLILDGQGRIVESTRAAQELWGYSESELTGRSISELGIPWGTGEIRDGAGNSVSAWSGQREEEWREGKGKKKDGTPILLEMKLREAKWGRTPRCYILAVRRKEKEEDTELSSDRNGREGKKSGPFNSEHLPGLSHDLRTPVNGIIGFCILLKNSALTPQQRSFIQTIHSTAEHLLGSINDILDFSKLDAGKLRVERLDFNLMEVVENTLELLAERAHSKGLEISSRIDNEIPAHLCGDPWRLRQVLTNLVGNAIKFTEQGEVVVRVSPLELSGPKIKLRFEVCDTGIGIPDDVGPQLFQPYQQGTNSTARQYGGTGLGLAISKQLVELMGGEIGYTGVPARGTIFWFTVQFENQANRTPSTRTTRIPKPGLHLLVVDQNDNHQQMIRDLLTPWRLRVESVSDSKTALDRLRHCNNEGDPYQVVLADLHLPGQDGLSLARAIRNDPVLSPTRVILLSLITDRIQGETLQSLGITEVLTKPVRQKLLLECIHRVMDESAFSKKASPLPQCLPLPKGTPKQKDTRLVILVVEDDPVNQKVAVGLLEMLGYSSQVATHGQEVFEVFDQSPPELILMDCQLPGMDGFKLAGEIRRREQHSSDSNPVRSYIVGMTANSQMWNRQKCLEAGMDDYINKPLQLANLKSLVEKVVRMSSPGEVEPVESEPEPADDEEASPESAPPAAGPEKADPMQELIDLFVQGAENRIKEMQRAMRNQEAFILEQAAHNLRGCAGSIGAERMVQLCTQLEEQAQVCSFQQVPALLADLEAEFDRFRTRLDQKTMKTRVAMEQ